MAEILHQLIGIRSLEWCWLVDNVLYIRRGTRFPPTTLSLGKPSATTRPNTNSMWVPILNAKCNDPYFAAEMPKKCRKGSRNMLWIAHIQESDNSGLEFGGSLHLEPKSHQRVVAHVTIVIIVLLCYSVFVLCAWTQGPPWWQSCIAILRIKLPTDAHKQFFLRILKPFCPMQGCTEVPSWTPKKTVWLHVVFLRWFVSTFGANLSFWTLGHTLSCKINGIIVLKVYRTCGAPAYCCLV